MQSGANPDKMIQSVFIGDSERSILHHHPCPSDPWFARFLIIIPIMIVEHTPDEHRALAEEPAPDVDRCNSRPVRGV